MSNLKQIPMAVGVPFSGRPVVPEWAVSYARQAYPINMNVAHITVRSPANDDYTIAKIAAAREEIASQAMKRGCKYLLLWDDDVQYPLDAVRKLVYALEQHRSQGFVAISGIYCLKSDPTEPIIYGEPGGGAYWSWKQDEVFEIAECGAGCLLIDLEAIKDIPRPWFKYTDAGISEDKIRNHVQTESCSEDLYFCRLIREHGFKLLAHGGVLCNHWDWKTGKYFALRDDSYPVRDERVARALTIPGWMSHAELVWLVNAAQNRHCILELGSYQGRSTRAIADNMFGRVLAFDSFEGIPNHPTALQGDAIRTAFLGNLSEYLKSGHVQIVEGSHENPELALAALNGERPDMIFIDGDHTYEGCLRDMNFWKQHLAEGGILCGHDADWPGVQKAISELSSEAIIEFAAGSIWFVKQWVKQGVEPMVPENEAVLV